jgi:molybdopterin-binding protein
LYLLPCQERPGSAERLGLREGSAVTVVIKSTNVLLATDQA